MGLFVLVTGRRVALFARGHGKSSVQVFVRNTIGIPCLSLGDKSPRSQERHLLLLHKIMGGRLEGQPLDHQVSCRKENLSGLTPEHDDDVECSLSNWMWLAFRANLVLCYVSSEINLICLLESAPFDSSRARQFSIAPALPCEYLCRWLSSLIQFVSSYSIYSIRCSAEYL